MTKPNAPTPSIGTRVTVEGRTWVYTEDPMWATWRCQTTGKDALYDHHCALTAVAGLEAERDHQANRAEEAEAAWTEEKQDNIRLKARVAELETYTAYSRATIEILSDEVREVRERYTALRALVRDVADSQVDPEVGRIGYVTVNVDRHMWAEVRNV